MTMAPHIREFFARLIEAELGIVYGDHNAFMLETRLNELVKFTGSADIEQLYNDCRVRLKPDVKAMLLDLATNNETSFFRDPDLFGALKGQVFAGLPADAPIRVWCAASSTGQEPYTVAMILDELRQRQPERKVSIMASDISDRVLARARSGRYTQLEVQRGLPAPLLIKYFQPVKDEAGAGMPLYELKPEIRSMVSFRRLNLLEPFVGIGPFDVVLCRNVLIYQAVENKRVVIDKIAGVLAPGGVMALGAAESLVGITDRFEMQSHGRATFYRLRQAAEPGRLRAS